MISFVMQRILSSRAIRSQFGYYDAVLLCTELFLILSLAHNLAQDIPEVTIYPLAGYFGVVGFLECHFVCPVARFCFFTFTVFMWLVVRVTMVGSRPYGFFDHVYQTVTVH